MGIRDGISDVCSYYLGLRVIDESKLGGAKNVSLAARASGA